MLFNEAPPESFKNINFKNIETLDSYLPFKNFFEGNAPYLLKADLVRLLIVREKGGVYLDSDYAVIKDMTPVISKYDQIFTLEAPWFNRIGNCFFASIPYGPLINSVFDKMVYNLNLNNHRAIELNSMRDFPQEAISKTMMHLGPIAYTEAIYDKLRICGDDCGEYVVMSLGVFSN